MIAKLANNIRYWWRTRWTKGFDKMDGQDKLAFCIALLHRTLKANPGKAIMYVYEGDMVSVTCESLDMEEVRKKLSQEADYDNPNKELH